jgi:hypothetical protein
VPETDGDLWDSEKRLMIYYLMNNSCECRDGFPNCLRCDLLDKTQKAWPSRYVEVLNILRKKNWLPLHPHNIIFNWSVAP